MTIHSLCLSLRSIMSENPITNEPGFEGTDINSDEAQRYILTTKYNTLKWALLAHLNRSTKLPEVFQDIVDYEALGNFKYIKHAYQYREDFDKEPPKMDKQYFDWKPLCRSLTDFTGDVILESDDDMTD